MTEKCVTKRRFATFDEYLTYNDATGKCYELLNGELVELPPESGENLGILAFVFLQLAPVVGHLRVRWGLELEVRGGPKNRYPDLAVIREEHDKRSQYQNRGIPEYWLLGPTQQIITILGLKEQIYEELGVFKGTDSIQSLTFPNLVLTAERVLGAGQ